MPSVSSDRRRGRDVISHGWGERAIAIGWKSRSRCRKSVLSMHGMLQQSKSMLCMITMLRNREFFPPWNEEMKSANTASLNRLCKQLERSPLPSLSSFHSIGMFVAEHLPAGRGVYGEKSLENLAAKIHSRLKQAIPERNTAAFLQSARRAAEAFSENDIRSIENRQSEEYQFRLSHVRYLSSPAVRQRMTWVQKCFRHQWSARELASELKRTYPQRSKGGRILRTPAAGFRTAFAALQSIERLFAHTSEGVSGSRPPMANADELERLHRQCSESLTRLKKQLKAVTEER